MKNVSIQKCDYIDALRGFAILGVVALHSAQWIHPSTGILDVIAHQGARGVQLFFLVSALTLFLSLDSRIRHEDHPVADFFIRRFFRIAPMFYLAIIIYSSPFWVANGMDLWKILLTVSFLHGWHPESINSVVPGGWTIAVEMTFYLFVPLLFLKLRSFKSTLVALILTLLVAKLLTVLVVSQLPPSDPFTFYWFFSQLPIFILGILLFHIIRKYPDADIATARLLLVVALFLFAAFLTAHSFSNLLPTHFLYGIAFLIFSLSLYYSPHKLLVNSITVWIGRLSFSIYLVHFMVIMIMKRLFPNGFVMEGDIGFLGAFVVILLCSCLIAYMTYRSVELPGIALGKRVINKYL